MSGQRYQVKFTEEVKKQLRKLDKPVQRRVRAVTDKLESDPRPSGVKKLKDYDNRWRVRVGDWRIIYEIRNGELVVIVVKVAHRSKAYKDS